MELIRYVGKKLTAGGYQGYSLFRCNFCNKEVVRRTSAARYKSCGCAQRTDHEGYHRHTINNQDTASRTCLLCGDTFPSSGRGNRRCSRCEQQVSNNTSIWSVEIYYKIHTGRTNVL